MAARRRPGSVIALVALAATVGVLVAALGSLFALAGFATLGNEQATASALLSEDAAAASALALGMVFFLVGAAQIAVAVALWRGNNGARVILTVLVTFQLLSASYDVFAGSSADWAAYIIPGVVALAALVLAWLPSTRRYFQSERDQRIGQAMSHAARSVRRRVLEVAAQIAVLGLTIWWTPGVTALEWYAVPIAAVAVAVVTWALQPVTLGLAGRFGWGGALAVALLAQAATLGVALWASPGVEVANAWWALVASWIFAVLTAAVSWAFSVGTDDYLMVHATRMAAAHDTPPDDGARGVIMIQLDGVPAPLLEQEIRAGNLPHISRWIRSGSHTWTEWTARVPSTTPVSQAGILHGTNDNIPAFRWWDRELGRMVVANKPADAAVIEQRLSTGDGLLVDNGVSISNLFTGDAPRSYLTMSAATGQSNLETAGKGLGDSHSYSTFFAHPAGFARALVLTLGEMVKETVQARRQVRRDVQPRVHRGGAYVLLRGVTNVMLRDLNVSLVVESMVRGARSVYVDFVDYDEIAHHAGVTRPESLASLYGLDAVVGTLERVAKSGLAAREYDFVLVSDHGQSQGATFLQRAGVSLEDFVAAHVSGHGVLSSSDREGEGAPAAMLVGQLAAEGSRSARVAQRRVEREDAQQEVAAEATPSSTEPAAPPIAVVGSGNLGGIWFTDSPTPLDRKELERRYPDLLPALVGHDAVGFVVVRGAEGAVALGPRGTRALKTGAVTGEDPLAGFPSHAAGDFARALEFAAAPDIYVNSLYDPVLDEVAAFEELVGCHGGVGGWQTRPLLVYPAGWAFTEELLTDGRLHGADALHRQLVTWLKDAGHRG